jgi:hypothetical protein
MTELQRISSRGWTECIVAAPGPSLTEAIAERCRGQHVIAVNLAYRRVPWAEVLYAGDRDLIELYDGFPDFAGEKWSAHEPRLNDKRAVAVRYGLRLVTGPRQVDALGFSLHPAVIHYGNSSGFQAINLAMHFGATLIKLVGFDMRTPPDGQPRHFHEDYPDKAMNLSRYEHFHSAFAVAAKMLPAHIRIVNCTPGSALRCFPMGELEAAAVPA